MRANEVQNSRQILVTNTVICKENPDYETLASPAQPARDVTLKAKGYLEQEPQPFKIMFGLLFHAHEKFQMWTRASPQDNSVDKAFMERRHQN